MDSMDRKSEMQGRRGIKICQAGTARRGANVHLQRTARNRMEACVAARWGSVQKADLQAEEEELLKINMPGSVRLHDALDPIDLTRLLGHKKVKSSV